MSAITELFETDPVGTSPATGWTKGSQTGGSAPSYEIKAAGSGGLAGQSNGVSGVNNWQSTIFLGKSIGDGFCEANGAGGRFSLTMGMTGAYGSVYPSNGYMLQLETNGTAQIWKNNGSSNFILASTGGTGYGGGAVKAKFERVGTTLNGYLNDVLILTAVHSSNPSGFCGMTVYGPSGASYMEDFTISDPVSGLIAKNTNQISSGFGIGI